MKLRIYQPSCLGGDRGLRSQPSPSVGFTQGSPCLMRCFGHGIAACGTPSALSGWGHINVGRLVWPRIPVFMSTLQYRHNAPHLHGAMCPRRRSRIDQQRVKENTFEDAQLSDITSVKGLSKFALGELFVLPQTFGNIFLGEVFSSYVSVHNDSNQPVKDIVIKTDLQTSSQRLTLSGTANMPVAKLDPEESFDQVIQHEVKELGTHILVCAVSYACLTGEKMYFRKFFKFQVLKPLDVKTKFYNAMDDEVFLEAQVQNITSSPMVMESVKLEPSSAYTVTDLNVIPVEQKIGEETGTKSIFGQGSYMNPNDTRQYLYKLTPVAPVDKNTKVANVVGKLDIVWRTAFGERGRLQTSQLQRVSPPVLDIKMSIVQIPDAVLVEKRFPLKLKLRNTCDRKMDLKLFMTKSKDGGLMWCGTSGKTLGPLLPGNSVELQLNLLALAAGMQSVGGLQIVDCLSSRTYELDNLSQVFVYSSEISPFLH